MLTRDEIKVHRRFKDVDIINHVNNTCDYNEKFTSPDSNKINVCIWGGNKMDGQKKIWLQQMEHMVCHNIIIVYICICFLSRIEIFLTLLGF